MDGAKTPQTPVTADMPSFQFAGYTLRPAVDSDLDLATEWTQADPEHCVTTRGAFWLRNDHSTNSFILCDQQGAIFFFRMDKLKNDTLTLHMQFAPEDPRDRKRLMQAMLVGFGWLEKTLSGVGVRTVYFNSRSPRLIHFCQKRLKFIWDGRCLVRKVGSGTDRSHASGVPGGGESAGAGVRDEDRGSERQTHEMGSDDQVELR